MVASMLIPNPFINMLMLQPTSLERRTSASAPEETLELGGAVTLDAGASKLSDGLDVGTHPTSPNVRGMLMDGASVAYM